MSSIRDVFVGALTRFLPGAVLGFASIVVLFDLVSGIPVSVLQYPLIAWTSALTAGFAAALLGIRSRLRADADVRGRRSLVAGFCSAGALAAVGLLAQGLTLGAELAVGLALGSAVGMGMYFPWIRVSGISKALGGSRAERGLTSTRGQGALGADADLSVIRSSKATHNSERVER
jgi:hypothetical protein